MFDPMVYFHNQIGEPIGRWFVAGGFEKMVFGLAYLFAFAVAVASILAIVDLVFGLGIFSNDGCPAPDPYDPLFEGDC
jgi:hypothetical protein